MSFRFLEIPEGTGFPPCFNFPLSFSSSIFGVENLYVLEHVHKKEPKEKRGGGNEQKLVINTKEKK